jgi:hypothetical protein
MKAGGGFGGEMLASVPTSVEILIWPPRFAGRNDVDRARFRRDRDAWSIAGIRDERRLAINVGKETEGSTDE